MNVIEFTDRELCSLDLILNAAGNAQAWAGCQDSAYLAAAGKLAARKVHVAREAAGL